MGMHEYRVGGLYRAGRTSWPEAPQLRMISVGVDLVLFYRSPTPAEIQEVRAGKPQFAWVDSDHSGLLAYKFGSLRWADAPYSPHPERRAGLDSGLPAGGATQPIMVILVDAATGIIQVMRMLAWPARFAAIVQASITRLLATPDNPPAAAAAIDALYQRYPDSAQLVRQRADAQCTAGSWSGETPPPPGPDASPVPPAPAPPPADSPAALIAEYLGPYLVADRPYPSPLPADLAPWHCYTADAGHSLLIAVASRYTPQTDPGEWLAPVPVRSVLRLGWQPGRDGVVVVDVPYHPDLGVVVPDDDTEW